MKVGKEYKNYKEMCKAMKEEEKTGKSRKLQIKRWKESVTFHREGHRIIIDEVKGKHIREPSGGNHKHVDVFMPYIIYCLYRSGIDDEYVGTQRLLKTELKLVPDEVYRVYNKKLADHTEYLNKHGIGSYVNLTCFVHYFETTVKETFERCMNKLEKEGVVKWSPGYVFVIGIFHKKGIYVTGFEEIIKGIETAVCNEMNYDRKDLKGRQYLHVIKRSKELTKKFYEECLKLILQEPELVRVIEDKYTKEHKMEFNPSMIISYHQVYYIEKVDRKKLRKCRIPDPVDNIRMKKAFVNPDGPEIQTLKEKVYRDIFQRMNKKKRYGIPAEEFESMTFLIRKHKQKLSKKDYSPSKEESQVRMENGNMRAEN